MDLGKMIRKIRLFVILLNFCSFFLVGQLVSAQESNFIQLLSIAESSKLTDAEGLLAPFYDGKEHVKVIVSLVNSPNAEVLSQQSRASASEDVPPGTLYFDLKDERVKTQLRDTVRRTIDSVVSSFGSVNIEVTRKFTYVFGFSATVDIEGLQHLLDMEEVVDVSEDIVLEPHLSQGIPLMRADIPRSNYNGAGLSIAICDSGIDTAHPRLGNGGTPIFNSKVIGGYDTGDNDSDPRPTVDGSAHGTACAGISAGNLGTVGDYIGGVAPGSKLYAIKISGDTGIMTEGTMVAGWEWVLTHKNDDPTNPIMIISTSCGGNRFFGTCDTHSAATTQAAANAVAAGITIFASSGNDGYCDSMGWPACISSVNSVGAVYDANIGISYPCVNVNSCASKTATTECSTGYYATDITAPDKVTSYSNIASFLTILGPANAAYTTDMVGAGGYNTGGDYYSTFGGTSAACPYVAGAAAVLQSAAKSLTGSYLTPTRVTQYLTMYGNYLTDGKVNISKPRVNLAASVSHLSDFPTTLDFPWILFYAILGAGGSEPPPALSQWGVYNQVSCSISSTTFSVTLQESGLTKSSTVASGSSTSATFSGYSNATIGPKSFTWKFNAGACGSYAGSFNFTFVENKRYTIIMEYISGSLVINTYSTAIPDNQINSSNDSLSFSFGSMDSWTLDKKVVLPITESNDTDNFSRLILQR